MLQKPLLHKRLSALNPTLVTSPTAGSGHPAPEKVARPADVTFRLLGQTLATPPDAIRDTEREFNKRAYILKPIFAGAVMDLHDELELAREGVANQAAEHIHSEFSISFSSIDSLFTYMLWCFCFFSGKSS